LQRTGGGGGRSGRCWARSEEAEVRRLLGTPSHVEHTVAVGIKGCVAIWYFPFRKATGDVEEEVGFLFDAKETFVNVSVWSELRGASEVF
jgi:hypothetical protein